MIRARHRAKITNRLAHECLFLWTSFVGSPLIGYKIPRYNVDDFCSQLKRFLTRQRVSQVRKRNVRRTDLHERCRVTFDIPITNSGHLTDITIIIVLELLGS